MGIKKNINPLEKKLTIEEDKNSQESGSENKENELVEA